MSDFNELLTGLDGGKVRAQLDQVVAEVIDAVDMHGTAHEKGEVTLKLTFAKEGALCAVNAKITAKPPREQLRGTPLYFDGCGQLKREDPRQLVLGRLHSQAVAKEEEGADK